MTESRFAEQAPDTLRKYVLLANGAPVKLEAVIVEQIVVDLEELTHLRQLISTPHIDDFLEAVRIEAAHQVQRWGTANDRGKAPQDWFWLLGWLSGKAVHAAIKGNAEKALHHTISSAAVLLNWHAHMSGARTKMRPGIDPPAEGP